MPSGRVESIVSLDDVVERQPEIGEMHFRYRQTVESSRAVVLDERPVIGIGLVDACPAHVRRVVVLDLVETCEHVDEDAEESALALVHVHSSSL